MIIDTRMRARQKPQAGSNSGRLLLGLFLLCMGSSLALVDDAEASHFRYGTLSYVPVLDQDELATGQVEFRLLSAFRRTGYSGSGADGRPILGDIITETVGNTRLSFGDGNQTPTLRFRVVSFSADENWIVGEALHPGTTDNRIRHTYSGTGPFNAQVSTCCRVGGALLNNRANGSYLLRTVVSPFDTNRSPVSQQFPIVTVAEGTGSTFSVPATDGDGDELQWRFSTNAEAGGGAMPPGMSIDAETGIVTWNNDGLNRTRFWTVQVMVEDLDSQGNVRTQTPVDFLLRIADDAGQPPECELDPESPITTVPGQEVEFTVTGTDPDEGSVVINAAGLPPGAAAEPTFPAVGTGSVSSSVTWTPTADDLGSTIILFNVTDDDGQQVQCQMRIEVVTELETAEPCDDVLTLPSWDGSVISNGDGTGSMVVLAPLGLARVDFYNSENLMTDLSGEGFVEDGTNNWLWDGDEGEEPAEVTVLLETIDKTNPTVRFWVRLHDTCPRVVDLDPIIALGSDDSNRPTEFMLEQNYPNPFNPTTQITFQVPLATHVNLIIYDVMGREIRTLMSTAVEAGSYTLTWDGTNAQGDPVSSGTYLYRLEAGEFTRTNVMMFMK